MRSALAVTTVMLLVVAACTGDSERTSTTAGPPVSSTTHSPSTSLPGPTTTTESPGLVAELILTGGEVVTMDPTLGTVEALAIVDGRILALGSELEISRHVGEGTVVVDLDGNSVIPGIVDAHTHILGDVSIRTGQAEALANGITTLGEGYVDEGRLNDLIAASDSGELVIRTNAYLVRTNNCGDDLGRWYEAYPPGAQLAPNVRAAGVKVFADGGTCGNIAGSQPWLEGYENAPPFHDQETLVGYLRDAHDSGYQVLLHAIGDVAISNGMDAYELILEGGPNTLRHRIDHNSLVTPDMVGRYGEIGIVPVLFGWVSTCSIGPEWTEFWQENGEEAREIIDANPNSVVAWHGDDPWVGPVSPLIEMHSLVTRSEIADDGTVCQPPVWLAEDTITQAEALAMMTTGSSYALGVDGEVGSLTPGKLADLVVLSGNPLTVEPTEIPAIDVIMTMIGGMTEYCAPGAASYCPGWEIAGGAALSASASRQDHSPELAFDGIATGESFWSSGADAPGWIQVEYAEPTTVSGIRFTVYQNPPSETLHILELLIGGDRVEAQTFIGFTATGDVLEWRPEAPMMIDGFRLTTTESASWPEWFEIEVDQTG